ncbi:MAG TPA: response regulator, partial [Pseudomonadales bacterium]|nr:response regulator [Pseudomonadales bacterium]
MEVQRFGDKRVLVVEDHAEMRTQLKSMLERMNLRNVEVVVNGEEAIERLKARQFDIILCDYELGRGKDGSQVLEEARVENLLKSSAVFVMITAAQTVEMVMGALEYEPDGYIAKP